jgi:DNA-binding MarR family transcriptional regulator
MVEPHIRVPPGFDEEFPEGSALATECFMNFGALAGAVVATVQRLVDEYGLPSVAAFNVLAIVDGAGGSVPPSIVAERMLVSRATITGVLDSLERRDLARRAIHPDDGRMRQVEITPAGRRLVRRLVPAVHKFERDLMTALDDGELARLLGQLARLQQRLHALAPEAPFKTPG